MPPLVATIFTRKSLNSICFQPRKIRSPSIKLLFAEKLAVWTLEC